MHTQNISTENIIIPTIIWSKAVGSFLSYINITIIFYVKHTSSHINNIRLSTLLYNNKLS